VWFSLVLLKATWFDLLVGQWLEGHLARERPAPRITKGEMLESRSGVTVERLASWTEIHTVRVYDCVCVQVNRSPSFGTDEQLDYDIKSGVIEDAVRMLNIKYA